MTIFKGTIDAGTLQQEIIAAVPTINFSQCDLQSGDSIDETLGHCQQVEFIAKTPEMEALRPQVETVIQAHIANAIKRDDNKLIIEKISLLEDTVTPRRIREAVLGIDNGWLSSLNTEIATLRASLQK